MAKSLELTFGAEFGDAKLTIRNPKDSLTPTQIKTAMTAMIASTIFASGNGDYVTAKSARYVDRVIEDVVLP